jgi:hypothetical protein
MLWYSLYARIFVVAFPCVVEIGSCRVTGDCRYKQDTYTVQQCSIPFQKYTVTGQRIESHSFTKPRNRQSCLGYCDFPESLKKSRCSDVKPPLLPSWPFIRKVLYQLSLWLYNLIHDLMSLNWRAYLWRHYKSEISCKHGSDFHGLWISYYLLEH